MSASSHSANVSEASVTDIAILYHKDVELIQLDESSHSIDTYHSRTSQVVCKATTLCREGVDFAQLFPRTASKDTLLDASTVIDSIPCAGVDSGQASPTLPGTQKPEMVRINSDTPAYMDTLHSRMSHVTYETSTLLKQGVGFSQEFSKSTSEITSLNVSTAFDNVPCAGFDSGHFNTTFPSIPNPETIVLNSGIDVLCPPSYVNISSSKTTIQFSESRGYETSSANFNNFADAKSNPIAKHYDNSFLFFLVKK